MCHYKLDTPRAWAHHPNVHTHKSGRARCDKHPTRPDHNPACGGQPVATNPNTTLQADSQEGHVWE